MVNCVNEYLGNQVNNLLAAYGQPTIGDVPTRRKSLKSFIGIVSDM
jgi:hypothetical protein